MKNHSAIKRKPDKKKAGTALILIGLVLLLAAAGLLLWNRAEDDRAGGVSEDVLEKLSDLIPEEEKPADSNDPSYEDYVDVLFGVQSVLDSNDPSYEDYVDGKDEPLPTVEIDGVGYIGYISIPDIGRELPVAAEWSYDNLKISPCRYHGSPVEGSFVICAHNYDRHFGPIKNLTAGAGVTFTAMDGRTWTYEVLDVMTYQPTDVEKMISGEYDLMLFTCTYGGKTRVVVGCMLV